MTELLQSLLRGLPWVPVRRPPPGGLEESDRLAQHARAQRYGGRAESEVRNDASMAAPVLDVEVLITAYRYRSYLSRAITSAHVAIEQLRGQGLGGGIAVVEDCGGDGSWELAGQIAEASSVPMRLLQPARNIGLTAARNLALSTSTARTVFVLDADNAVYRWALVELFQLLTREGATAAYGPIDVAKAFGRTRRTLSHRPVDREWLLTRGNYIDAMALFDAAALKQIGGWDGALLEHCWGLEDYELWIRLILADHRIAFHPRPIGRYRWKRDSMARTLNPSTWDGFRAYMQQKYGPVFNVM